MRCSLPVRILFVFVVGLSAHASQKPEELGALMSRVTEYVARYEEEFANLRMDEIYIQNAAVFGRYSRTIQERLPVRRIESEFWIFQYNNERSEKIQVGIRTVNKVDNFPVERPKNSVEDLAKLGNSPAEMHKLIDLLRGYSAKYDIGGVERTINAPTFALHVARATEAPRFTFEKRGTDKIGGVTVWKVEFHEKRGPTLVHARPPKYEELKSSGNLWIDPASGRILKTEFVIENPYSKPWVKAKLTVFYVEQKKLGMYVPSRMVEHYETEDGFIDCEADYTNVRAWTVESSSSEPVISPR